MERPLPMVPTPRTPLPTVPLVVVNLGRLAEKCGIRTRLVRQPRTAQGSMKHLLVRFRTKVDVFRWPVLRLEKPVLLTVNRFGTEATNLQLI